MTPRFRQALLASMFTTTALLAWGTSSLAQTAGSHPFAGEACAPEFRGGSLTIATPRQPRALDVGVSGTSGNTQGSTEYAALYDTLMRFDVATGEYLPKLAQSLVPNTENTVWTLKLRPGITFGDGTPLNAAAVILTAERVRDGLGTNVALLAKEIEEMVALDDLTVEFRLKEPWGTFPHFLSISGGMVMSPAAIAKYGDTVGITPHAGAGAGAYELESFTPGESILLSAKKDYWDGEPCIETLTFVQLGGQALHDAFTLGELDIATSIDPLINARFVREDVKRVTYLTYEVLLMNQGHKGSTPPTRDLRLRQAIAAAINPAQINARALNGEGIPSNALTTPETHPRLDAGVGGPVLDLEKARKLVEEVKAEGWDGRIRLLTYDNVRIQNEVLVIAAQLKAIGIDVEVEQTTDTARVAAVGAGTYELSIFAVVSIEETPWGTLGQNATGVPPNRWAYSDPRMDAALKVLKGATTLDEQREGIAEVQRIWNDSIPMAIFNISPNLYVFQDRVKGVVPSILQTMLLDKVYLDPR